MIFQTVTGSTYEVQGDRIRRLGGTSPPTKRVGIDGEWREFQDISRIQIGKSVVVHWCEEIIPAPCEGGVPLTVTSPVEVVYSSNKGGSA